MSGLLVLFPAKTSELTGPSLEGPGACADAAEASLIIPFSHDPKFS